MGKVWERIRVEAQESIEKEHLLRFWLKDLVIDKPALEDSVAAVLASRLAQGVLETAELRGIIHAALAGDEAISEAICADLEAVVERDPACDRYMQPLLYMKGFHAIQSYRVSNSLWKEGRKELAFFFQSRISEVFAVDIHPAAQIGNGLLIDHATSVVIGETAIVEDNVSLLHEVTLGGTGKESGDRHPVVRSGVLIGAGAKVLGRVEIGRCAKVGAGSVVLDDVPPHTTVAGVPAEIVGETLAPEPAREMDHHLKCDEG